MPGAIFDLDGTILDSMPIWENAAEMFLNRIGVAAEPGLSKTMFAMTLAEGAEYLRGKVTTWTWTPPQSRRVLWRP